jgi:putative peptide zinc metalloprotease protein
MNPPAVDSAPIVDDAVRPAISGPSRLVLYELRCRREARVDECVIGRVDTGEFIAVPLIASEVVELLAAGLTVDEVHDRLRATTGRDIDVAGFAGNLIALGFVSSVDGRAIASPPPPRPTLPRLRPVHVRWLLSWPAAALPALVIVAAVLVVALHPRLLPTYSDLLWTDHTSVVLAGNALLGWAIIAAHEFAHLATARSAGVPGRMSLGTRLQFLVAQTDVSGIWAAPRRQRMTVYLAGLTVNLVVAAVAILARAAASPGTGVDQVAADLATLSLVMVAPQFLLFMRTDLYFVLQDLTGCRNLYADGSAYVRWRARQARTWLGPGRRRAGPTEPDPSAGLVPGERHAVHLYAWLLAIGTTICIAVAAGVSLPFAFALLSTAVANLVTSRWTDGVITLFFIGGYWVVWCRAWWRRHGPRLRAWSGARRR